MQWTLRAQGHLAEEQTETWWVLEALSDGHIDLCRGHDHDRGLCLDDDHAIALWGHYHLVVRLAL